MVLEMISPGQKCLPVLLYVLQGVHTKTWQGGKLKWQLTENKHKSSYTFLDNIVYSEILAADILADPSKRASIGGKAYNINDDIEALFWTKTYDV